MYMSSLFLSQLTNTHVRAHAHTPTLVIVQTSSALTQTQMIQPTTPSRVGQPPAPRQQAWKH